ncbi:MAG: hypothetical protein CL528_11795 [Aequorivita sp.]|jgi:hypothetical protein|nr:hypothetical protein [Aequorivita sp.]MBP42451.1 hypothetical protein [Aequorivita sp.]HBC05087.1 hypothetical protein [Aequorivita sp.]|tara:strand:+ start:9561 stop:9806 length:246 start_codon:yes stop_codon:yes gene_type:complete
MRSLAENSAKKEGYQSVKLYNPNDTLMGLNTKELALQVRQKTDESKPNERTKVQTIKELELKYTQPSNSSLNRTINISLKN